MIKLEPISNAYKIMYPEHDRFSEFEVQAYLYGAFMEHGFDIRGEMKVSYPVGTARKQTCRFDLVVFVDEKPFCIFEVKRRARKHKAGLEKTRQAHRYRQFGVDCFFVYGMDDARTLLEQFTSAVNGTL